MTDIAALSNEELRNELIEFGVNLGPIVGTTRNLYEKKLLKLRKEGKKVEKTPPTPSTPKSKTSQISASSKRIVSASGRRNISRYDESSQEDDEDEEPVNTKSNAPLTSSPSEEPATRTAITRKSIGLEKPANNIIPGLSTGRTLKSTVSSKLNDSSPTKRESFSRTTTILSSETPSTKDILSKIPSSSTRETISFSSRYSTTKPKELNDSFSGDRPGATPPRKTVPKSKLFTSTTYTSPSSISRTSSSRYESPLYKSPRGIGELGYTTEEDDNDEQRGEESTRYIFSQSRGKIPSRTVNQNLSPLRKLWNKTMSKEPKAEFKVGAPATLYDLRMGSTRTRFERDPKTGRCILEQKHEKSKNHMEDLPRLLIIILAIFSAVLSIAYVSTAQKAAVMKTVHVVSGAVRDSIHFLYAYAVIPIILVAAGVALVLAVYFGHKKYNSMKDAEEAAVYDLVDKIIDMVRDSAADGEECVRVPHVRDVLFPPAKRRVAEMANWERAVQYINENESRVATETRLERGVECAVWRWLQPKKTGWQGKAFSLNATSQSPNVPKEALTNCLKIREMFSVHNYDACIIEKNLREKLMPVRPLHVGVFADNNEGIVFVMLRSKKDAKSAFTALHGEWFNSRLVNVKYVRNNRYIERYPVTGSFDLDD